jgi:L-malate glycosyltransferase
VLELDGITVYKRLGWAVPRSPKYTDYLWRHFVMELARVYARDQGPPTLIYAQWALRSGVAAREIASEFGCPYVITEHFTGFARKILRGWEEEQAKEAYGGAAAVSAVSKALARTIAPFVPGRTIEIVPNCIRGDRFPISLRQERSGFRFLTVCHLSPKKRVDLLIRSFSDQFRGDSGVELIIGGDGPDRPVLEQLARSLDIAGQVIFLGQLDYAGVRDVMRASDVFVLPSDFETFGVVIIEAMATGMPVIATASGGPEEIICQATGLVVPVGDQEQMGAAMMQAYVDRYIWRAAGPSIRSRALARYSDEVVGGVILDFCARALGDSAV